MNNEKEKIEEQKRKIAEELRQKALLQEKIEQMKKEKEGKHINAVMDALEENLETCAAVQQATQGYLKENFHKTYATMERCTLTNAAYQAGSGVVYGARVLAGGAAMMAVSGRNYVARLTGLSNSPIAESSNKTSPSAPPLEGNEPNFAKGTLTPKLQEESTASSTKVVIEELDKVKINSPAP